MESSVVPLSSVRKTSWYLCLNLAVIHGDPPGQQNSHTERHQWQSQCLSVSSQPANNEKNLPNSYVVAHDETVAKCTMDRNLPMGQGHRSTLTPFPNVEPVVETLKQKARFIGIGTTTSHLCATPGKGMPRHPSGSWRIIKHREVK